MTDFLSITITVNNGNNGVKTKPLTAEQVKAACKAAYGDKADDIVFYDENPTNMLIAAANQLGVSKDVNNNKGKRQEIVSFAGGFHLYKHEADALGQLLEALETNGELGFTIAGKPFLHGREGLVSYLNTMGQPSEVWEARWLPLTWPKPQLNIKETAELLGILDEKELRATLAGQDPETLLPTRNDPDRWAKDIRDYKYLLAEGKITKEEAERMGSNAKLVLKLVYGITDPETVTTRTLVLQQEQYAPDKVLAALDEKSAASFYVVAGVHKDRKEISITREELQAPDCPAYKAYKDFITTNHVLWAETETPTGKKSDVIPLLSLEEWEARATVAVNQNLFETAAAQTALIQQVANAAKSHGISALSDRDQKLALMVILGQVNNVGNIDQVTPGAKFMLPTAEQITEAMTKLCAGDGALADGKFDYATEVQGKSGADIVGIPAVRVGRTK